MTGRAGRHPAPSRAVVIGGGVAGLASAALLAREGLQVTVLEAREELGGRAGTWQADGFRFDTGPSWYLMPEVFDHFFRLLGTTADKVLSLVRLDPGYRVFFEGQAAPLDVVADRVANLAAFEAIEPGAAVAVGGYLDSAEATYRLALDHFLYTGFDSPRSVLSWPVLRGSARLPRLLAQSLGSFVAGHVTDRRLRQVLGYPAIFLGTSPDRAPSLYHLMSSMDLGDGVRYPMGGFGTVVDALGELAADAGATLLTGSPVTEILTAGDPARAAGVRFVDRDGTRRTAPADLVVSAADLWHTETRLLPEHLQTYPESWWKNRDPGFGAVLVCLGVRGRVPELAHHTLFFTADWQRNFAAIFGAAATIPDPASVYVCAPSRTDPTVAPADHENLFVLVPVPAEVAIGSGGVDGGGDELVERTADAVIAQIGAWTGVGDLAERIVVRRTIGPADFAADLNSWRGSALGPAHTLRQSAMLRASTVSRKVAGLHYVGGTALPGIGLPMCLISAELLIKRLRGDHGSAPLPEPA